MKKSFFKASGLMMLIAVVGGWLISTTTCAAPHQCGDGTDNYAYHSEKFNVNINMPNNWRDKITTKEDDQSITVSYNNPGGQPVFLYSVTKLPQKTWMDLKDQLQTAHVVSQKDGVVYIVQLTDKTSIKGTNAKEFKAIVANLNEVLANVKVS